MVKSLRALTANSIILMGRAQMNDGRPTLRELKALYGHIDCAYGDPWHWGIFKNSRTKDEDDQ